MARAGAIAIGVALAGVAVAAAGSPPVPGGSGAPDATVTAGGPSASSRSPSPHGAGILRVLGSRAAHALAPVSDRPGALVRLPAGQTATSLSLGAGVRDLTPGFARLQGSPDELLRFASGHPELPFEIGPTLHPLLDRVGVWTRAIEARATRGVDGTGVLVGVADTGLDVSHPAFRDASGHTRVAWLLDLSLPPIGKYPDLESQYGITDASGKVTTGAVFDAAEIDARLSDPSRELPTDDVGHGTHVTSIAAGRDAVFPGVAPGATILVARVTHDQTENIENDDVVRGAGFLYDRAAAMNEPVVVNISLGTDFGPHDGTMQFEDQLASYLGEDKPGQAMVVAAGNSGSVSETPIHTTVHVSDGQPANVSIPSLLGAKQGSVDVWITFRDGAALSVGFKGADGTVLDPVAPGVELGITGDGYTAGVVNGSSVGGSQIPAGSNSAVLVWTGAFPAGDYSVTLTGTGTADLYLQTDGDVGQGTDGAMAFAEGVREGTINLPATHPAILSVGCTVNRTRWTSITGVSDGIHAPLLDPGGVAFTGQVGDLGEGDVAWFSSAGPTETGVAKPEISAPGGLVIGALSSSALPGAPQSIFTTSDCPAHADAGVDAGPGDPRCLQIDATHGIALGTSMSSPMVAGAVALLLQKSPTLTEPALTALLREGAHHVRGAVPFQDQPGVGELDVEGALAALDETTTPRAGLPAADASWLSVSSDVVSADGRRPVSAFLQLRTAGGVDRADQFDAARLAGTASLPGASLGAPLLRRVGPGLWSMTVAVPAGYGGETITLGATFDGAPLVTPVVLPVASDVWTAHSAAEAGGSGCAIGGAPRRADLGALLPALAVLGTLTARQQQQRRRRRRAALSSPLRRRA